MEVFDYESADEIKDLESRLYSLIHHEAVVYEDREPMASESTDVGSITQGIFNNKATGADASNRFLKKPFRQTLQDQPELTINQSVMAKAENQDSISSSPATASMQQIDKNKQREPLPTNKRQNHKNQEVLTTERNNFNKNIRTIREKQKQAVREKEMCGPFRKQAIKLEKLQRLEAKKKKSLQVRNKRIKRQLFEQSKSEKVIDIIDLDSAEEQDDDDVIHVPLPAPPIIDVDDSNGEEDSIADNEKQVEPTTYIEENALDAADVELSIPKVQQKTCQDVMVAPVNQIAICNSPSSSILSTDDFIGQKDRRRLKNNFCDAVADHEDLILFTSNVSAFVKPAKAQKKSLPSNNVPADKESYRVEKNQLRSVDVYESESDITESGVYSKTRFSLKPTIIRSVDSSSAEEEDVQVVESVISQIQKTKKLRKRRSSNPNKESLPHTNDVNPTSYDNSFDDDLLNPLVLHSTGVPYISRGIAVEGCKWSHVEQPRGSSEKGMSDNRFTESLNNLAKGEQANNKECHSEFIKEQSMMIGSEGQDSDEEKNTDTKDSLVDDLIAVPIAACEGLDGIFNQIDSIEAVTRKQDEDMETFIAHDASINNEEIATIDDNCDNEEIICSKSLLGWNNEMNSFYNNSWNGVNFNLNLLLSRLENRRQLWMIKLIDRFPKSTTKSNLKCFNCCEFGHKRSKCKQPKKMLVCNTCGEAGHQETRCPRSICLGCGHKTQLFVRSCNNCTFERRCICPLCKVRGHGLNSCPDKWRRYHSTTQMNVPLENQVKYREIRYCSICGAKGHLAETCKTSPRFMDYPSIVSTIKSHRKVYDDRSDCDTVARDLPMANHFSFQWRNSLQKCSYYVRFLKAVGIGYDLKRKTKVASDESTPMKRLKVLQLKTKTKDLPAVASLSMPPNQVQEISESGSTNEQTEISTETENIQNSADNTQNIEHRSVNESITEKDAKNRFKAPKAVERMSATSSATVREADNIEKEVLLNIDSDSNYSFSEHFELPSSTTMTTTVPAVQDKTPEVIRLSHGVMDNLPEIIPLCSDDAPNKIYSDKAFDPPIISGISMCFSGEPYENDQRSIRKPSETNQPCECKIFLQSSDSDYLFSPNGQKFLTNVSKICNVNVRMDFTSCGFVLIVYGTEYNQSQLHVEVLKKCKEMRSQTLASQSQKPPKRIDVLIKFLREGICQLFNDLGNANEHHKDLIYQQRQNTKNGSKTADKKRRLLNMILLGQAGLFNGNTHLDELLQILRKLITNFKPCELASEALRNSIEMHWRMIFTSFQQDDYHELLRSYNKLATKNRLFGLNINPSLLGQKVLNTTLNLNQVVNKHTINDAPNPELNKNITDKTNLPSRSDKPPIKSTQLPARPGNVAQKMGAKRVCEGKPPFANPVQHSGVQLEKDANVDTLLLDLVASGSHSNESSPANQPSMFWSREADKYVKKCLRLTRNQLQLGRLYRAQRKSKNGDLSHNDYCAIVKLYYSLSNN